MARFPQDFPGLLIPVAIVESVAGIFKSKFNNQCVFLTVVVVEIVCATIQSLALIVTVAQRSYSRDEIAAAYLTIIVDAVLLFVEAYMAFGTLEDGPHALPFTLWSSGTVAGVLGVSGLPIFIAKLRGRVLKPFKSPVPRRLMLSLPLLTALGGLSIFCTFVDVDGSGPADNAPWLLFFLCVFLLIAVCAICVSLALGIVLLTRGENLSLAFLVISNLYPAILTFVVILLRAMFANRKRSSSSPNNEASSRKKNTKKKNTRSNRR